MNALSLVVTATLILGWAFDPSPMQADFDSSARSIVREPIPLRTTHGREEVFDRPATPNSPHGLARNPDLDLGTDVDP